MKNKKTTFAILFANRGFFPGSLQKSAREEIITTLEKLGHQTLTMGFDETKHGAVETPADGEKFAKFLQANHGKFGGVIVCLPNFGDEEGAVEAVKNVDVPIFVQAYPDEMDKLAPEVRRDAFCGKISIMDVFKQFKIKFTHQVPHVVHPHSKEFAQNIDYFDRLCRVVNGLRSLRVGQIGARTTPFKTVRVDEIALQQHGISIETFDLSSIIGRVQSLQSSDKAVKTKADFLNENFNFANLPEASFSNMAKLALAIDELVSEHNLGALSIRCWIELQQQLGVSPCVLNALLCEHGLPTACEVDTANAIMMTALQFASDKPVTILDWNNNYADDPNKCILFHCGNVPPSLLTSKKEVIDHAILANTLGEGKSFGCYTGRFKPTEMTFGSLLTDSGKIKIYLGEGKFTNDKIPEVFFGNAGVAEFENLEKILTFIADNGHRHHVSLGFEKMAAPLAEAFEKYLNCEVTKF